MVDDFLIARNPDDQSRLPYLLRLPLGRDGVVLKARETWPRTSKVYCHPAAGWPADAEVVERVPVRSCVRRGAAIDLVLDRGRENRSQIVFTRIRGGREAIFWQTARTSKQARPNVSVPRARASGIADLSILVDVHERYAWRFADQQASTEPRALPVGDYAVELDGHVVAAVERKSLQDLVSSLLSGKLGYALGELAAVPHAAVVVEERYSKVFGLTWARPAVVADGLAECAARWPNVPIHFCDNRSMAQEWAFRFLGAALRQAEQEEGGRTRLASLPTGVTLPPAEPTTAQVRAWAQSLGYDVSDRGRLRPQIWAAWHEAHDRDSASGS
ncbi:MAG TPA: ERCC4 domain-containing protein [Segeticoccus sp.]|uniref:ERCC4 domain-containing protein n=1 Tax=Segeticoccus sp. TaxID=2706531 RepID=UPI002D807DE3|nr:ERCC4 domain-containing protein [Segeticoccus sp.]HET8600186.1 ERCC4 domain-containing protein [Segeticoccus sp.]